MPNARENGLQPVADYIKELKLKKAVVGGVDQEDAYKAMRQLTQIFSDVYGEVVDENDSLRRQLAEAKKNRGGVSAAELNAANAELVSLRAENGKLKDTLRDAASMKEASDHEISKLKGQLEELRWKVEEIPAAQLTEGDVDAREVAEAAEEKLRAMEAERDAALSALQEAESKAQSVRETIEAAETAEAEAKSQLKSVKKELEELRNAKELDRSDHETLEEIYIDANRRRQEILAAAGNNANEILTAARQEEETMRQKIAEAQEALEAERQSFAQEMEEERARREAEVNALLSEGQADLEARAQELAQDREALEARRQGILDEANAKCDALLAEAEKRGDEIVATAERDAAAAKLEAQRIVNGVGETYRRERAKYEAMLLKLSELRTDILSDIRGDIDQLQKLAFDLTGRSLEQNAKSNVALEGMPLQDLAPEEE
ncbi:MAG: hypothetical protein ACSW8F_00290 [bacterium]